KTLEFLENAHPNFKGQNRYYLTFKEASHKNWFYNFYYHQLKGNYRIAGMDMLNYFRYSEDPIETHFHLKKVFENELTAKFTTRFGKEKNPTGLLVKALLKNEKFILLKDRSLGVLTQGWLTKYEFILLNSSIEGDEIRFAKWV